MLCVHFFPSYLFNGLFFFVMNICYIGMNIFSSTSQPFYQLIDLRFVKKSKTFKYLQLFLMWCSFFNNTTKDELVKLFHISIFAPYTHKNMKKSLSCRKILKIIEHYQHAACSMQHASNIWKTKRSKDIDF